MTRLPRWIRRWAPLAVVALLAGCKDDRVPEGDVAGQFLSGGVVFGFSQVSAVMFRYQNETAERILQILESNLPTPIFENGCAGGGQRIITRDLQNPNLFRIDHQAPGFTFECGLGPLILNGQMFVEIVETSPGLHYRVQLPFNFATAEPEGLIFQGGIAILNITTPGIPFGDLQTNPYGLNAFIDCVLEGTRPAGRVRQLGTMRIEDRQSGFLLIETLDLLYEYDETVDPTYAEWPGGSIEIGGFGPVPGAFIGGSEPAVPVDVAFDGFGGATFTVGDRTCEANMETGANPCEDF